ncbi:fumarate hydratase [Thiotrichales bacterium HSG1]|nr:fumarate hydratase [Thiotrichales bacterium HSG1]
MTIIKAEDFVRSIADAFQFISYYHPIDYVKALEIAYEQEKSAIAKDAIKQILVNSKMCAEQHRPICQDTGIAVVFLKIGMDVKWQFADQKSAWMSVTDMVNEGVRQAYTNQDNLLRASILTDPIGNRENTKDNTPAVVHMEVVSGDKVEVKIAAKGGGSENKSKLVMLNPNDSIVDWVLDTIPKLGAGWCPPGILGLGIGGTAEKAMLLAKEALMAPIDIHKLQKSGANSSIERLRLELYSKVNSLGIGAQGLGGLTTVLDVKILDYPTHAASLPVAMIPNCAATRHTHFTLDGSGVANLVPPTLEDWPKITWQANANTRRVNIDNITKTDILQWQAGESLLLSGKLLTGRDAAHNKIAQLIAKGQPLPEGLDFNGRFIYYVGPVDAINDEAVGPAGPTTATRMDKFTDMMLEKVGIIGMIGKAERGPQTIESIRKHKVIYLIAVGGAAYLVSKAIRSSRILAFPELGMEAIYEFEVKDMPVMVAVDTAGESIHRKGPLEWKKW